MLGVVVNGLSAPPLNRFPRPAPPLLAGRLGPVRLILLTCLSHNKFRLRLSDISVWSINRRVVRGVDGAAGGGRL